MVWGVLGQDSPPRFSTKLELKFLEPLNTVLTSTSTALFIFKTLTLQGEILLGKHRDFKAFHRSLSLQKIQLIYFQKTFSLFIKNHFQ